MLIVGLTLKGELAIGEDVKVRIVNVTGGRVAIGIDAPEHVRIRRKETIKKESANSSKVEDGRPEVNTGPPPKENEASSASEQNSSLSPHQALPIMPGSAMHSDMSRTHRASP